MKHLELAIWQGPHRLRTILSAAVVVVSQATGIAWAAGDDQFVETCRSKPTAECVMGAALDLVDKFSPEKDPLAAVFERRIVDAIMRGYTASGDMGAAYKFLKELKSSRTPGLYESALDNIAHAEAHAGNVAKARQLSDSAKAESRPSLLVAIAEGQATAGDVTGARRTLAMATAAIGTMREDAIRVIVMTSAARLMSRLGDSAGAEEELLEAQVIAKGLTQELFRAVSLSAIASTNARLGRFETALSIAHSIERDSARATALCGIIRAAVEQNRPIETDQILADALVAARSDNFPPSRANTLGMIAGVQSFLKDNKSAQQTISEALRAVDAADTPLNRSAALHAVAVHQARLGDVPAALTTAQSISVLPERALALLEIAAVLADDHRDSP